MCQEIFLPIGRQSSGRIEFMPFLSILVISSQVKQVEIRIPFADITWALLTITRPGKWDKD